MSLEIISIPSKIIDDNVKGYVVAVILDYVEKDDVMLTESIQYSRRDEMFPHKSFFHGKGVGDFYYTDIVKKQEDHSITTTLNSDFGKISELREMEEKYKEYLNREEEKYFKLKKESNKGNIK